MRKIILILLLLLIGTGIMFIPAQSGFLIRTLHGNPIYFIPGETKDITIGWTHSVELTPWEENYRVMGNGELSLESTIYQAYGAGTPDIEGKVEILPNGYIQVTEIKREIPYYSLFYVANSGYFISHNETQYLLKDFVPDYESIHIRYEYLKVYEWIYLEFHKRRVGSNE